MVKMSFGTACLISVVWHFFWISSITIVSLPAKVQLPRFSEISFLGSLLDEPSFEVHVTHKPMVHSQPLLMQRGMNRSLFQEFPRGFTDPFKIALPYSKKVMGSAEEYLGLKKKNPSLLVPEKGRSKKERPLLEGPVALRTLYYFPALPELPKWVDPKEVRSNLELRFWVSPEGKVISVDKMTSSGDPTVDLIGMRYLRRWQFNPKRTAGEEWGTVTLRFTVPRKE